MLGMRPRYRLNPFFRIRFGKPLICELLLDSKVVSFSDPQILRLLPALHEPLGLRQLIKRAAQTLELSAAAAAALVDSLMAADVLVPEHARSTERRGVSHWVRRNWTDALALHLASRNLRFADNESDSPRIEQDRVLSTAAQEQKPPPFWKEYAGAFEVPLERPRDGKWLGQPLEEVLLRRRSSRPMLHRSITNRQLSHILFFANEENANLRARCESEWSTSPHTLLRSTFCAFEAYVFVFAVDGLEPGIYHYCPKTHRLRLLRPGVFRAEIARICIGQRLPSAGCCAFLFTSVWQRYMWRYRHPRAYRNLLISMGEYAHQYLLLATAHGLSTFLTPALEDDYAAGLLGIRVFEEAPLYVVACG
jgi:SagB-type dehydrogenase family enzyme